MFAQQSELWGRLRIEFVVWQVDARLDGIVPWRRRKAIRQELRTNLREATAAVGANHAIQSLGGVRELAAAYVEGCRGAVNVRAACIAAGAVIFVLGFVGFAIFFAYSEGFRAAKGVGDWAYNYYGLFEGSGHIFSHVKNGVGDTFTVAMVTPLDLLLAATVGVLASRPWRGWRSRSH
jgi:hypothetical protein